MEAVAEDRRTDTNRLTDFVDEHSSWLCGKFRVVTVEWMEDGGPGGRLGLIVDWLGERKGV